MNIKIDKVESNLSDEEAERIMGEYEKQLDIPKNKPAKLIMLCPIGLVGSGKTTVIKPLSEKLSLLRISTDEIRKILKENSYDYNRVEELAIKLSEKYIRQGYSIAIDADCISERLQKYINELKGEYGSKLFWIHINPPEKFIINKLKNYKHTWLFKNSKQAIENYKQRKSLHRSLKFPFIYEFDTSKSNLNKQIEEASKIIKDIVN